jgi:hypothetical protein
LALFFEKPSVLCLGDRVLTTRYALHRHHTTPHSRIRKKSYHIRKNSADIKNFMDRGLDSPFSKKRSISVRAPASPRSLARSEASDGRPKKGHADDIFDYEGDGDDEHASELDRERSVAASAPANTSPIALEKQRREVERTREKRQQKAQKKAAKQGAKQEAAKLEVAKREKATERQRSSTLQRVERVDDIERARSLTLSHFNFEARLGATKKQVDEEIVQLLQGWRPSHQPPCPSPQESDDTLTPLLRLQAFAARNMNRTST